MGIEVKNTRHSNSFIGRFNPSNDRDMEEFEYVKAMVRCVNQNSTTKLRVVKRGRKPAVKMMAPKPYYYRSSDKPVSYDVFGNIVGGIKNATEFDVYIYKRSDYGH